MTCIGSQVSLALITSQLAGGSALWSWRRDQHGLAARVEPHVPFSALAGVRSAIATDPAHASDMIDRLVDHLRASISRPRADGPVQATVGAQLDIVRACLGLMAARMPRLQWSVDAPADLPAAHGPPLMLISLAENAVEHDAERKIGPARVDVSAEHDDQGRLVLTVADDGPGFQPTAAGSGLGLANIRKRLSQLYPGQAELQLKARAGGGVAARLVLPLEPNDNPA